ncbi:unnamed protein product, partial [Rotaria magnacalcarata]
STAADLLTQKQQEDNESDYERGKENESSQDINLNVSEEKCYFAQERTIFNRCYYK